MSQHPSLKINKAGTQQRSVLKRYEKVKTLHEKKIWEDVPSIYKIPKVKTLKIKAKKGKAAAPAAEGDKEKEATTEAK